MHHRVGEKKGSILHLLFRTWEKGEMDEVDSTIIQDVNQELLS